MAKAEFGSAKYLSNQLKAKGLQKLRFYCQVCQKQCRDENGFKSHIKAPSHLKNISQITEADIDEYTKKFQSDFLKLLRLSHGEKKIEANKFYNQFIQDKSHIHMNATRFTSLTKFVYHLSQQGKITLHGLAAVPQDEMNLDQVLISYVDNSKENILRKATLQEIEMNDSSEQDVKAKLLQKQIQNCIKDSEEENSVVSHEADPSTDEPMNRVTIDLMTKKVGGKVSKRKLKTKKKNVFK